MPSVTVANDHPTDACTNGTNALEAAPQASSPPPQTPWLVGTTVATQPLPDATGTSGARGVSSSFPLAGAVTGFTVMVGVIFGIPL